MIITRTPYRISFFGGGTDYPSFFNKHGGSVLSCTIDKYCHVLLRKMPPFLGTKYRIFWSKGEAVDRIEDIEHPGVRGCLKYMGIDDGIEVNHAGDLPARSGLGSSSAFTVGMLHALHALNGESKSRAEIAKEAIHVEQNILHETVGIQDQIACANGGLNYIDIDKSGSYGIRPVILEQDRLVELQSSLMLFFTGIQRFASEIAKTQVDNIERKERELKAIHDLVPKAVNVLCNGDLDEFGRMLHETWTLKRMLSDKVSNETIDDVYSRAIRVGALGGKILGAGGGGFLLMYVRPKDQEKVRQALGNLVQIPVQFENYGTQVIHKS